MNLCTCTKDREATCIIHPTERSLKNHIAQLEAERIHFEAVALTAIEENAKLQEVVDKMLQVYKGGESIANQGQAMDGYSQLYNYNEILREWE